MIIMSSELHGNKAVNMLVQSIYRIPIISQDKLLDFISNNQIIHRGYL